MNPKIDEYINKAKQWQEEMELLRSILLSCQLTEELKWGVPCYTFQKSNVVLIHAFKEYVGLGFFKGALLKDDANLLSKPGENSQSSRQLRYTSLQEIQANEQLIRAYLFEAIEVEKAGLKVTLKKTEEYAVPVEFQKILAENSALNTAYEALTPGRKRAYLLHFSGAKQAETRIARIEKMIPRIMIGKGFNDCICGLSKRMPGCDGSHKFIQSA
ncbi:MAG: hypothetical protein RLZZ569_40 [Bacteroidota bacterium]|jgi:uncharacterized protein YdeI (YjbR/CyaY-like superfamily)